MNGPQAKPCPFQVAMEKITRYRLGLKSNEAVSRYLRARGIMESTSPASIGAYMRGDTAPKARKLNEILDALEATPEERERVQEAYWATEWRR